MTLIPQQWKIPRVRDSLTRDARRSWTVGLMRTSVGGSARQNASSKLAGSTRRPLRAMILSVAPIASYRWMDLNPRTTLCETRALLGCKVYANQVCSDEHYRRSPGCPFFALAGTTAPNATRGKKER